jgi:opacity protein-like surface antigen
MATPLLALIAGLTVWLMSPATMAVAHQDTSSVPVEVGSGPIRERSLEFTGRNTYRPDSVEMVGYLTSVIGLDATLLFTDDGPSERTARFTYAGNVSVSSRSDRGDVTAFEGEGVLQIFLDDGGASWDDPPSFADGQPVAELSIRLRDTLHRQAPGVGVLVGDGVLSQETAAEFTMDGEVYRFGDAGIEQRLRYVGALMEGSTEPPSLAVSLTGNASVVVRESIPVSVGQSATAVATPPAEVCPDLQPWLDQTMDGLTRAQALRVVPGANQDVALLDEEAVRQAAAEMASLGEAQRGTTAPEAAVEANRLVITALSTYARGLGVIADAAAEEDADLLAQGQSVVADGSQLLERAVEEVAGLVDACAGSPAPAPESA